MFLCILIRHIRIFMPDVSRCHVRDVNSTMYFCSFQIITEYSSYARNTLIIDSQTYEAAEHRVTIDLYPSMPTTNNFVDEQPVTPEGLNRNEVLIEACSVTEFCADITTRVIGTYLGKFPCPKSWFWISRYFKIG